MRIVVLDGHTLNPGDNPWDAVGDPGELTVYPRTDEPDIIARAGEAEIVVVNKTALSAETLAELVKLRFVAVTATGYNIVDVAAARDRGVLVANVPEYGTDTVAQFTFALLLELCHHVGGHAKLVEAGRWAECPDFCFWDWPLVELAGSVMGIVGFGRIGRRVGELAHAFGMAVLACDVAPGDPPAYRPFRFVERAELFAASDVVSLHCPLTPDNTGMVDRELLATMKPTAMFINTARGQLVVQRDLADALNAGTIAAAAVDVMTEEPIEPDNPLPAAANCIVTPHIAWATLAARRRLMAFDWPGNVRQLEHLIHQIVITNQGTELTADMLGSDLLRAVSAATPEISAGSVPIKTIPSINEMEQSLIREALEFTQGSIPTAAKQLGLSQTTLYRKIKKFGLQRTFAKNSQ